MGEEDKREQHGSADRKRGSSDGQRTLDSHRSSRGSQGHAKAREKSLGWARPQRTFARAWATSGGHPGALHRGGGLGRSEEATRTGQKICLIILAFQPQSALSLNLQIQSEMLSSHPKSALRLELTSSVASRVQPESRPSSPEPRPRRGRSDRNALISDRLQPHPQPRPRKV